LYDAIAGVWAALGFDDLSDAVFRDLVIVRVVEPASLSDAGRVLAELGRPEGSLPTRKRTLGRCSDGRYRDRLAGLCGQHAAVFGDLSLILYDVTTLRTTAAKEDGFRKVGYSKERSVDPQVTVGLLADRGGFPLEIGCFEGNKAEKHTIVPIVEQYAKRCGKQRLVVVADAGMLSADNLKALDEAGYRFIVGSRMVKAPADLASHFRWHGDAFEDGQIIDTLTPKTGASTENDPHVKAEPAWDPDEHPGSWRAVWEFSAKRFARDNRTLTAQENRARAVIAGEKQARKPRFVKTSGDSLSLDLAGLARARRLAGLKGYATNIPAGGMPATELIARYHDLWHIEESFRISKSDLAARPLFARTRDAIETHLTIVFAALAVSREIQNRTGWTIRRVVRAPRPLRSATIRANGVTTTIPPEISSDKQKLLDSIQTQPPGH
jgi:hypothetical protein